MKSIDGVWWPDWDRHCHKAVAGHVQDIKRALPLVGDVRCAVQAGGNVGLWANALAKEFDTVWTFEPDLENFYCLARNLKHKNINAIHAGLGDKFGFASLELPEKEKNNVGAYQTVEGADFVVLTIDSLKLEACDLMVLDTEGTEPLILEGAKETLTRFKPILMIEDKGLSERYGAPHGWTDAVEKYVVADRVHRDVILVPDDY